MSRRGKRTSLSLAAILILSLACSRSAGYYIERGKQLRAQGRPDEAALNFQKALKKDPRNGAAYLELGSLFLEQKNGREAYRAFFQAVEILPDNEEANRHLADLCLAGYLSDPSRPKYLYDRLNEIAGRLLARDPDSFDGSRLKGILGILDRKPEQALEHLRKANATRPNDPRILQALTQVLFELHLPDEAEETALQLVGTHKDFGPIYDTLYRYYESAQRAREAERLLESKAASNPKNASFALQLAAHYARMNNREAMAATLRRLLDARTDFPQARLQVGDFYLALGDPQKALAYYQEGARGEGPDKAEYRKRVVMMLVAQHKGEQGLPILEEILKVNPRDLAARAVRANLLIERPAVADRERAVSELQDLVSKNPREATLRYGLGRALAITGKPDLARRQFNEAIRLKPDAPLPRFALAELALRRKEYREALEESAEILKLRPGDHRARLIRATGLTGLGALAEASQEIKGLLKTAPGFGDAELLLGSVYLAQKKYSEAEAIFLKLSRSAAPSFRAVEGLAQLYLLQNQPKKALDAWSRKVEKTPEPPARLALAATANAVRQPQLAIQQYQALLQQDPNSAGVRHLLAVSYELNGEHAAAIEALQKTIELDAGNFQAFMTLGQLLEKAGRAAEAVSVYRRLVRLQPNDAMAMNNLAFALSETGGNLDEALDLAQRAQKLRAGHPNVADTVGWIYMKQNMPESALQIFKMLVKNNPDKATYRYHLGAALLVKGDKAAARIELQTALEKSPSKEEERKILELLGRA